MKNYPSIPKIIRYDVPVIVEPKYDGSLIRSEFSFNKGFYKFGTKNQLIDSSAKIFGRAIDLIKNKYEEDLAAVFKEQQWRHVTCFFELFGPSSFAGWHKEDEQQDIILFDVAPYKEGLLEPRPFFKIFRHLDIPPVLYEGRINATLLEQIKQSALPGISFEGCVCKGQLDRKLGLPTMFKIKTNAWLDKLKAHVKNDEKLFAQLS